MTAPMDIKAALSMLLDMDGPLTRAFVNEGGRKLLAQIEAKRGRPLTAAQLRQLAAGLQLLADTFYTVANERDDDDEHDQDRRR